MTQTPFGKLSSANPCKDCVAPKRYPGCHAECEDRAEWLVAFKEMKATAGEEARRFWALNNYEKARSKNIKNASAYIKNRGKETK